MTPADARRLHAYQARIQQLASDLSGTGFVSSGSVVHRFVPCGKPGCRCQADPPQLHGPYWQWSRVLRGKTVTRRLTENQARLYQEWIANRRRLTSILAEMDKVSQQAATILLREAAQTGHVDLPDRAHPPTGHAPDTAGRVTRHLAEALLRISELVEPLAELAQQWLDSKDDGDHDALAEARHDLATALAASPDLFDQLDRLARLASPWRPAPRPPGRPSSEPSPAG
jgi:Family of unknown function (DUF6788)